MNRSDLVSVLLVTIVALVTASPAVAESGAPTVRLRESVSVAHGPLSVEDVMVGDLSGTNYSLTLGSLPEPGSVKYVSRAYIIMMARNNDVSVPEFAGDQTRTRVKRPVRTLKKPELEKRVESTVRDQLVETNDLNLEIRSIPESLSILPGPYELVVNSVNAYQSERGPVWYRFKIRQKGRTTKSFRSKITVSQHRKVPVAVRRLDRGTILQPDMIDWQKKKIGTLRGGVIESPEEIIGRELTRSVGAEKILRAEYLQKPIVIERRDRVTIRYRKDGVVITTQGEATEDGAVGDRIRVKNTSSEREVSAEVINEGLVEVNQATQSEGNES
ncbi:MAG: flagellar basal body P-ring formation chaperone FlgA [bacterium]